MGPEVGRRGVKGTAQRRVREIPVFVLKHMWYKGRFSLVVLAVKSIKTTSGNLRNRSRSSWRTHGTARQRVTLKKK